MRRYLRMAALAAIAAVLAVVAKHLLSGTAASFCEAAVAYALGIAYAMNFPEDLQRIWNWRSKDDR